VEIIGDEKGKGFHNHEDDMRHGLTFTPEQREKVTFGHYERRTLGWMKQCKCVTDEVRPAIVLDPFCGSGTTIATAYRMGRAGIGIDLSMKYLTEKAAKRIERVGLLFK
jgi:SAM-dependent methyltransferase